MDFLPDEYDWIALDDLLQLRPRLLASIAVAPCDGDLEITGRFSRVLHMQTGIPIIRPGYLDGYTQQQSRSADEEQRTRKEARTISPELIVDGELLERIPTAQAVSSQEN